MKQLALIAVVVFILAGSYILYNQSIVQSSYNGLPTVPCIDTTLPIKQSYTFTLSITINGQPYALDKTIGHDYGKCLHDIYVNDASGLVYVKTNGDEKFTLGNFFDVWKVTYNKKQLSGYRTGNGKEIKVFVNGKEVETYEKTPITPNAKIEIKYQ